jgi:hypothetical protein
MLADRECAEVERALLAPGKAPEEPSQSLSHAELCLLCA